MDEDRFVELEIKLAYQEDLLQELNKIVARQQQAIIELERACRMLAERIDSMSFQQSKTIVDEIPPHY